MNGSVTAQPTQENRALLSICVPTFNRANCLDHLLKCLEGIKAAHGENIEVCLSNNHSDDGTTRLIEYFSGRFALKTVTQAKNIGATLNALEVVRLATGRWILIIGDDDELDPASFSKLLDVLRSADAGDWVLVGVRNETGKEYLLRDLPTGRHSARDFRKAVLRVGLWPFGFIGMHVFPAGMRPQFLALSREEALPWPHVALFLRHLVAGQVQVFPTAVVNQAAGGKELFWRPGDWMRISLMKVDIVSHVRRAMDGYRLFCDALMLRELYSATNVRALLSWKVYEPAEFQQEAFAACLPRYRLLGPLAVFAAPHFVTLLAAYCTPALAFELMLRLNGKGDRVSRYTARKNSLGRFDGVERGL